MNLKFLLLTILLLTACNQAPKAPEEHPILSKKDSLVPPEEKLSFEDSINLDTIWLICAGDIMPASNFNGNYLPRKEGKQLFTDLVPHIQAADIAFGNFEGVLADSGLTDKKCYDPKFCYRFRIPLVYADRLKEAGFDLLNIACNHIDDFGRKGRRVTEKNLYAKGFWVAGLKHRPCIQFEKDGLVYGFCAFAPFSGCFGMRDTAAIAHEIRQLAPLCDVVIVSLHGGAEGSDHRHVTREDEVFLGFNRGNMYEVAHIAIDAGADVIIGTGQHVVRALELYKNRLIMYSLGNFCTYGLFALNEYTGYAPLMRVGLNKRGDFLAAQIIPIKQIKKLGTRFDPEGIAIQQLRELTEEDFLDGQLKVFANGWVYGMTNGE